jgi:hypothetical protein
MALNYFNSYFEILAGINLGYAVFNYFRSELTKRVFKIKGSSKLETLKSKFISQLQKTENDGSELYQMLLRASEKFKIREKDLNLEEEKGKFFLEVLKPISFIIALLCLTYLIISGFQEEAAVEDKLLYSNYYFTLTCFTAVFSFSIFYSSYAERVINNKIRINLNQILVVFFLLASSSCTNINNYFFNDSVLKLLVLIMIPIILFLIILGINTIRCEGYLERKSWDICVDLFNLCLKNWLYFLIYLSIIFAAFLPVILFRLNPKYAFVEYLIILATPLLLFVSLSIRTYFHSRKFLKKYNNLADEETKFLEPIMSHDSM